MAKKGNARKIARAAIAVLLIAIWVIGGWYLWQAARKAPAKDKESLSIPFSFIPDEEEEDEEDEDS